VIDRVEKHCHSNLIRAVLPYGLTEFDVHDVLNVFQCTGLNDEDRYQVAVQCSVLWGGGEAPRRETGQGLGGFL
jgi:uncharacterized protein YcgI (DUF1989 family)